MSSRVIKWKSVSLPESVIAGQSFILAVEVEFLDALYDRDNQLMVDSEDNILLPADGEYKSVHTGEDIDNFISEVLI